MEGMVDAYFTSKCEKSYVMTVHFLSDFLDWLVSNLLALLRLCIHYRAKARKKST
jgi:hypothetical protein